MCSLMQIWNYSIEGDCGVCGSACWRYLMWCIWPWIIKIWSWLRWLHLHNWEYMNYMNCLRIRTSSHKWFSLSYTSSHVSSPFPHITLNRTISFNFLWVYLNFSMERGLKSQDIWKIMRLRTQLGLILFKWNSDAYLRL